MKTTQKSKFLSLILRHNPQIIKLSVDENGWADIEQIVKNAKKYKNISLTVSEIKEIVANSIKTRFSVSPDGKKIKANHGHSIGIKLDLPPCLPPDILYHGTIQRSAVSIKKEGIRSMGRQFVHLSASKEAAWEIGKRRGHPIVFAIDAKQMSQKNCLFYQSKSGIYLSAFIPPEYISQV